MTGHGHFPDIYLFPHLLPSLACLALAVLTGAGRPGPQLEGRQGAGGDKAFLYFCNSSSMTEALADPPGLAGPGFLLVHLAPGAPHLLSLVPLCQLVFFLLF